MTASNETQSINGQCVTRTQSRTPPLLIHQFSHRRNHVKLPQCCQPVRSASSCPSNLGETVIAFARTGSRSRSGVPLPCNSSTQPHVDHRTPAMSSAAAVRHTATRPPSPTVPPPRPFIRPPPNQQQQHNELSVILPHLM
ncbi:hypothetical protein BCR44DRAFT_1441695 [Catenaria anguillulae PL171]|uniref:Uncharacterized protein n=1 Tax=Catenaria anguillulae PL171 TaxID=765915 RepID=A0A1Y2HCV5_9FUNG|nr:hypothetical protein BCR44DRAFT_1441695 [Catenaria anguillulae PL171]